MKKNKQEIKIGGRQTRGKSLSLVYLAQLPKTIVICATEQGEQRLQDLAKKLGLNKLNTKVVK